jgi:D-methionine transport system ATP-binding protein
VLERIRGAHGGRIITVSVTDRPGLVAAVARALTGNGVEAELVHGGIGELGGRSIGALTYALSGSPAAVDAALAALRDADLAYEEER